MLGGSTITVCDTPSTGMTAAGALVAAMFTATVVVPVFKNAAKLHWSLLLDAMVTAACDVALTDIATVGPICRKQVVFAI